jgi:hypothetical protein
MHSLFGITFVLYYMSIGTAGTQNCEKNYSNSWANLIFWVKIYFNTKKMKWVIRSKIRVANFTQYLEWL